MSLGGVTNLQDCHEHVWRYFPLAENGILGALTLKSSMKMFTVLDILLGVIYIMALLNEVVMDWQWYNLQGPHYFLTLFYLVRCASLPIGFIGFYGVMKRDLESNILLGKAYFNLIKVQAVLFPTIGLLSTYDMCNSYMYNQPCRQIAMWNTGFNVLRLLYLFYQAYIAKSYYRRLQRGERILVECGRSIVELIN